MPSGVTLDSFVVCEVYTYRNLVIMSMCVIKRSRKSEQGDQSGVTVGSSINQGFGIKNITYFGRQ